MLKTPAREKPKRGKKRARSEPPSEPPEIDSAADFDRVLRGLLGVPKEAVQRAAKPRGRLSVAGLKRGGRRADRSR